MTTHGLARLSALLPGRTATTFRAVPRSRSIAVFSVTRVPGSSKPAVCGLPSSKLFWISSSSRPVPANRALATSPSTLAAATPEPAAAVSKAIGIVSPALGERGPVRTRSPMAPASRAVSAL